MNWIQRAVHDSPFLAGFVFTFTTACVLFLMWDGLVYLHKKRFAKFSKKGRK